MNDQVESQAGEAEKKKPKDLKQYRLVLKANIHHPLSVFMQALKARGVKNFDLAEFILDVLDDQPQEWWDERLEGVTPLEHKINAALEDPSMRAKLSLLLANHETH